MIENDNSLERITNRYLKVPDACLSRKLRKSIDQADLKKPQKEEINSFSFYTRELNKELKIAMKLN